MKFNLVLPALLLESIDRLAKARNISRSLFISTILDYYVINLPFTLQPLGRLPVRRINIYFPPQIFIEVHALAAMQKLTRNGFIVSVLNLAVSRLETIDRLSRMFPYNPVEGPLRDRDGKHYRNTFRIGAPHLPGTY